jgi:hypothetical protein
MRGKRRKRRKRRTRRTTRILLYRLVALLPQSILETNLVKPKCKNVIRGRQQNRDPRPPNLKFRRVLARRRRKNT